MGDVTGLAPLTQQGARCVGAVRWSGRVLVGSGSVWLTLPSIARVKEPLVPVTPAIEVVTAFYMHLVLNRKSEMIGQTKVQEAAPSL